ncbi:MAG TPA: tyrosine-protein phosphatase [Blastocatellia bacterium]|nr:tyrosine-protein phosphatase [Blastocatellia bacterium]
MKLQGISLFRIAIFNRVIVGGGVLLLALSFASVTDAAFDGRKEQRGEIEESDVKNFGKVNDHIYRGGQPDGDEYAELAAKGIKTIIDLREDPESYARRSAERAGLRYINIRLNAKRPPTEAESDNFLQLVNDQKNWPVFVHCAGGRHRTGVLLAVYRMEMDGWDATRAYSEMKDYKFYKRFGYGDMKEYVFDYYSKMMIRRAAVSPSASRARQAVGAGQDN